MSAVIETPKSNVIQMPPNSERGLFSHPDCRFTLSGLEIRPGMPIDDWIELGQMLKRCGDSVGIWRGDYINYGKREYGKTKYEDAIALTGLKEQTLKNDVWISKAIPTSVRSDELTSKHYRYLAPLRNLNSIRKWIEKTLNGDKKKPWSAARLKKEIHKATSASANDKVESTAATADNKPKEPPVLSLRTRRFLDDYMGILAKWAEKIPVDLPASEREALELMIYQHGADAKRLKERSRKSDCDAILKVLRDTRDASHSGEMDANDLYRWLVDLRHFMAPVDYEDRLHYMNQDNVRLALLTDAGEGKQEGRKGRLPWIVCLKWAKIWKVSGKCERCKRAIPASAKFCGECSGEEEDHY
jgi:hypothetical protein